MARTSGRQVISTRQEKLAELARIEPKLELTTLAHHIDETWLREAHRRTRKDGAAGVDGVTAAQYEADLEANLTSLLERFKSGRYRAPAVRRVHIPKPGKAGKTRPIGIPTLEDKVLQRAVLMVLEPIYEQDFLDCSYGFRPGRSAHQALDALWQGLMQIGGGWVIDLDIQSFLQLSSYCPPTDADCPNGPQFLHKSFLFSSLRHDSRNRTTVSSADLTHCNSPLRGVSPPRTGSDGYRQAA